VRVQLSLRTFAVALAALLLALAWPTTALAQIAELSTTHTIYHEAPTGSHMTVYTPSTDLEVTPLDWLTLRAGWEADVVTGASIAVKAGPAYQATHVGADVVTAASVHDFRNSARGGFTLRKDIVSITGGYNYSIEHDYRSNSFNVAARTEPLEHDSQFEIDYAHNFDQVCNAVQPPGTPATLSQPLSDSTGCFTSNPLRTTDPIAIDALQGSWSQAWTPVFETQLIYGAQVTDGFQSDPYRAVIIANGLKAQENVPNDRTRQSLTLKANYYIRPIRAALRLSLRGYYDTWGISSETGELELEKYFGEAFRVLVRGRVYNQSGALFWSDDYTGGAPPLGPKGQYWTGDRELSPFWSWLGGVRAIYTIRPSHGRLLRMMTSAKLGLTFDVQDFNYTQFTLGGTPVTGTMAIFGGLTATAIF
jgi:hypothetical protein